MLNAKIGGIPILWIMMAQANAAKRKKKKVATTKRLALGDFVIDPKSHQWCRVVGIECVWKDPPPIKIKHFREREAANKKQKLEKIQLNRPLPEHKESYERALENAKEAAANPKRPCNFSFNNEHWITHEVKLEFADGKKVKRVANESQQWDCIRAPEIFGFDFEQLEPLVENSFRGVKKTKKKVKKRAKKKTGKKAA